jgi:site-specific recombinase XerD
MMKNNVSPLVMQRILGHSSLQTTLIYANPDDKMAQEIYKKQIG